MLAVARATAALCASINTVSDARSDAPEYFTSSEPAEDVAMSPLDDPHVLIPEVLAGHARFQPDPEAVVCGPVRRS